MTFRTSVVLVAGLSFVALLPSISVAAPTPIVGDELRIDFAQAVLEVTASTPKRVVLSGGVRDSVAHCAAYHTVERTYIGCSVEPDQTNYCVTTFQECSREEYSEVTRTRKIVLKFKGKLPRPGTEIRLQAKNAEGYLTTPVLSSNDPCLKFKIREGRWPLERKKPLVVVRNECAGD